MFAKMQNDEDEMPSWLIDDNAAGTANRNEQTPLIANRVQPNTSYGGQSDSSQPNVEENYGEFPTEGADNPWHVEPESSDGESDEEESVESVEDEAKTVPVITAWPVEAEEVEPEPNTNKKGKKIPPKRTACHSFFILIQISSCLSNIGMMATQLIPVFVGCDMNTLALIVRSYLASFAFFFLLVELEFPWFKKQGASNWILRGFMYTFLGTVMLEQRTQMISDGALAKTKLPKEYWNEVWASLYIYISSWWMISNGFFYFLLGLLCMRKIRDGCRKEYKARMRKYKDASDKV